jgi:hypothetical protein
VPVSARNLPWSRLKKGGTVSQRTIETIIGRLITDEEFRAEFLRDPERALVALRDRGLDVSRTEIAALVNTDPTLWARTADGLDPRLQKASLKDEARVS